MPSLFESYLERVDLELRRQGIGRRYARQVVEECRFHLESACQELEAAGCPPAVAEREALARFGAAAVLAREWAEAERTAPSRQSWVIVCASGLGLGLVASLPVGRWVGAALGMLLILPSIGLVAGTALGLSQGWALRHSLRRLARWVAGTALGLAVGVTGGTVLVEALGLEREQPLEEVAGLLLIGVVMGSVLALAQWHAACRSLAGSLRWVLGHGAGAAAGLLLGSALGHGLGLSSGGLALTLLGGAVGAAWAGSCELEHLLRARCPSRP